MAPVWSVDDLEIVGYANVLKETMLPSVVPPVFRLRTDTSKAFLTPYSFNAGFLCNASEVPQAELEELSDSREITLFDVTFPARADFELWIDQSFQQHYEPADEAKEKLSRIADEAIEGAASALRNNELLDAERLSGVAISADARKMEPLAIKAAIRRRQGNEAGEHLMEELAEPVLNNESFRLLVDKYSGSLPRQARAARSYTCSRPMHDMCSRKAQAA
jgi:hypothetical protein